MKSATVNRSVAFALLATFVSCGSPPKLTIKSRPPSASVYVNGERIGATPPPIVLPFDKTPRVWISIVHPQCQPITESLTLERMPVGTDEKRYQLTEN